MIHLSEVLDNYFKKKFILVLIVTILSTILTQVAVGYLKSDNELRNNLEVSSSIYTSLLYSKDWDLLNKLSLIQLQDRNIVSLIIKSKENKKTLYQFKKKQAFPLPYRCLTNDSSEILIINICKNIIEADFILYSFLGLLFVTLIGYFIFQNFKKGAISFFSSISDGLNDLLLNDGGVNPLPNVVEFDNLSKKIVNSSKQLQQMAKSTAIVDLSRKVAHDLRSPATVIEICCESQDQLNLNFESIKNASKRIKEIASLLLDRSRYNSLPNIKRINVTKLFDDLIIDKGHEYKNLKLSIEKDIRVSSCLWVSETELYRVLSNLINNAIEAQTRIEKRIFIQADESNGAIRIAIEDNGCGFNQNVIDSFFSKKVISSKVSGNAIGLSSATDLMEKHGGISISNTPTGGRVELIFKGESIVKVGTPIIQIEDDKYIRSAWKKEATKHNVVLESYKSFDDFYSDFEKFPKGAEFFTDINLAEGPSGLEISKRLHELGFKRISFSTGEQLELKDLPEFLNSVIDKKFPYE